MKIKLSKSQWNEMGKIAGWFEDMSNMSAIESKDINWAEFNNEWEKVKAEATMNPVELEKVRDYAQSIAEKHVEGVKGSKKGNLINTNSLALDIVKYFARAEWLKDDDSDLWAIVSYIANAWGTIGERKEEQLALELPEEEVEIGPDELEAGLTEPVGVEPVKEPAMASTASTKKNMKIAKIIDVKLTEAKKKGKKVNPWAVCTKSVGREDKAKYNRCVKEVKEKQLTKKD